MDVLLRPWAFAGWIIPQFPVLTESCVVSTRLSRRSSGGLCVVSDCSRGEAAFQQITRH